jgi:hypothetical protein
MKKNAYPKECPIPSRQVHVVAITIGLILASFGCNSEDESFTINGTWTGSVVSVAEPPVDISMTLIGGGNNVIVGSAQVTVPPAGEAVGAVDGTWQGENVNFTIGLNDPRVAGTLVFEGAFQGDDVISGTIDSGLLGGTHPVTFQR